ncbi:MAG: DNA ligase D [Gemmatimonadota bacterium]
MPARNPDRLKPYRAKRSPAATPEPFGGRALPGANRFVVQMHAASRLHYDLRLELNGVLLSWAVPRGPSPNPADKRLAVHTEDHPLEYVDFEGVIPEGNYGAGGVIVWDTGTWIPLEDPDVGLESGKLLFNLRGYKLQGRWTLVRTKTDWLLIKERDGWVREEGTELYSPQSIFSGLTAEQVASGFSPRPALRAEAERLGAPAADLDPRSVSMMFAEARPQAFTREGWIFEIKYDGYRLLGHQAEGRARLISRNGNDLTATFPELERALRGLPYEGVLLDGEAVVHDEQGLPSFQRLQKRGRLQRKTDILRASVELPAQLYAFDLLALEGFDLRSLPLIERKALLQRILPPVGPIRYSDHVETHGEAMFAHASRMHLEGIVGKDAGSPYVRGRSAKWIKVRVEQTDDFVVVGFTDGKGSRDGFGALHLGQYDEDGSLVYAGRVGTGFDQKTTRSLRDALDELGTAEPPEHGPVPRGASHHWVAPEMVVEVRYKEVTDDGMLRHPAFLRLREDKPPGDCIRREHVGALEEPVEVKDDAVVRVVHYSNLDKVFWPDEGYTKGDLIEYYRTIAPWLLPYLADRPLVLTRYPDGIEGKSFYQKNAPDFAPDWLRIESIWSEGSEKELRYFVCDDLESLLYVANSAAIPLHVWSSRVATLQAPDWCILDLDPKEAPFSDVVRCAKLIRSVTEEIDLPAFVKTSGSTGLHVLLPLGGRCTYEQSRTMGELLARVVVQELPEQATITRNPKKREGKVYIDYLQNRPGQLLVAPFSVRPLPGAPVSTPLHWREVGSKLDLKDHTIRTVPARLRRQRSDPFEGLLDLKPDLVGALSRLAARFRG